MSQRSHIAQSGSIAISACSAACSVAEQLRHRVEPVELPRLGHEPDRLGREASTAGSSSGDELDPLLRADRLALVADDLLGHLDLAEDEVEPAAALLAQRPRRSSVSVSFFACVYQSPRNGSTTARIVVSSSSRTRYDSPRWR